ncbi:hypothetical protein GGR54DRAFT_643987 [Hypoxylon sp. NC1633]|nr:hypothetical protein GGR54DRAFT_643987 [Hypoxylon sp. NC1633]
MPIDFHHSIKETAVHAEAMDFAREVLKPARTGSMAHAKNRERFLATRPAYAAAIMGGLVKGQIDPDDSNVRCQTDYGLQPMTQEEILWRYHFAPADIKNSTRIIWSNGEFDPTSVVSVDFLPTPIDRCASRMILTSDMAHREDLFLPDPTDSQSLRSSGTRKFRYSRSGSSFASEWQLLSVGFVLFASG